MKEAFFIRGKHQRSGKWQKKKKMKQTKTAANSNHIN